MTTLPSQTENFGIYAPPVFVSRDPLFEKYFWMSPYAYCANNPMKYVDPTGMTDEELYDKWRYNTESGELTWLSDEGGSTNQTVEMVHNGEDGKLYYNKTKAVNFDGAIDRMFDFSVCTPGVDKAVSGMMDVVNGAMTFLSGAAIGAGTTALSSGVLAPLAEPLGAAFCFLGGGQMGNGFKQIAEGIDGAKSSPYTPREVLKDLGYTVAGAASGKISGKGVFKTSKAASIANGTSFGLSFLWSSARVITTKYPTFIGIPLDATIIK